jgi:hypothetical protein
VVLKAFDEFVDDEDEQKDQVELEEEQDNFYFSGHLDTRHFPLTLFQFVSGAFLIFTLLPG